MPLTTKLYGVCSEGCACLKCQKATPCNRCDYVEIWQTMGENINCMEGGLPYCPFAIDFSRLQNAPSREVQAIAEEIVGVQMSANDIELECRQRGIETAGMDRFTIEEVLARALVNEYAPAR